MYTRTAKANGPYELFTATGANGVQFFTVPYSNVEGSQVLVALKDNFSAFAGRLVGVSEPFLQWAALEISIYGYVQGYRTRLKSQFVRSSTGPMIYTIPFEEVYDSIAFFGRNVSGGSTLAPTLIRSALAVPTPIAVNPSLSAMVYFAPRGGFETTAPQKSGLYAGEVG